MTREQLIEAMALAMHSRAVEYESTYACVECHMNAEAAIPAVVAFVAEWLEGQGIPTDRWIAKLATAWREDMGT